MEEGRGRRVKVTRGLEAPIVPHYGERLSVDTERLQTHFQPPPLLKDTEMVDDASPLSVCVKYIMCITLAGLRETQNSVAGGY